MVGLKNRSVRSVACKNEDFVFMPPTPEKLGAYWFGPVRPSVRNTWQLRNSRTAYARILKLYMWHVHEKLADSFFFPPPVLSFWSYAFFLTMYERPCQQNV